MKRIIGIVCVVLVFGLLAEAQIPKKMNYQGYLTDSSGNPVNGSYNMVFSIYKTPTGGTPVWQENRYVSVTNGRYTKNLGDNVALILNEAVPYYLGIKVGSDSEMVPREMLTSTMYAFFARKIEHITIKQDMVGIGTTEPQRELHIQAAEGHNDAYLGLTNGVGDFAEIGYDGDTDGIEFRIYDNLTKMYIGNNGSVGIGTSAPKRPLHLNAGSGDAYFRIENSADKFLDIGYDGDSHGIEFRPQGSAKFFVGDSGAVGIGTTAPGRPLHLKVGSSKAFLRVENSADKVLDIGYNGGTQGAEFRVQEIPRFFIADSGNVGVGLTSPTHKLTVNGAIRAKEVLVDNNNWPDFVFADSYSLMPLSDVEQHIQANKHLPGIPSARDVAEQGVSVGDMQAKLLQKVEELTLHMIALEKENARLRERVSSLETAVDATHE